MKQMTLFFVLHSNRVIRVITLINKNQQMKQMTLFFCPAQQPCNP